MSDPSTRVTIGMPLYNDEMYLGAALESLLGQTYSGFHLLISDNASTDGSIELAERITAGDKRVTILRRDKNIGAVDNINSLPRLCQTEYFMWAASDDVWHSEFLERMVIALDAKPRAALAFGTYTFTDAEGVPYGGPRNFDFSGSTVQRRVERLAEMFDDGCFYGLYRVGIARPKGLAKWHWPNHITPYNSAYPFLFEVLARGDMAFVESEPLWLNRIKSNFFHPVPSPRRAVLAKGAYIVRQIDLVVQSMIGIRRGTADTVTAVQAIPLLVRRLLRNFR